MSALWLTLGLLSGALFAAQGPINARLGQQVGQLLAGLIFDHMGAYGQAVREITWLKLMGLALLLAGACMIRRTQA
ncbi:MAG: DMT family transporter [Pseudomonadota bacterium]